MSNLLLLALSLTAGVQLESSPRASDPLTWIAGDWEIVDPETGEPEQACAKAQRFKPTADERHVDLTELGTPDFKARYTVVHRAKNRVLMFIDGEERLTDAGDPVLWWANFDGPDQFQWRRYDWPAGAATATWRRCQT